MSPMEYEDSWLALHWFAIFLAGVGLEIVWSTWMIIHHSVGLCH
jgi:hypothetical protein